MISIDLAEILFCLYRTPNRKENQNRFFCSTALKEGLVGTSTEFWTLFRSIKEFRGIPVLVTPWGCPGELVGRGPSAGIVLDPSVQASFPYGNAWAILLHEWGHADCNLPPSIFAEKEANRRALRLIDEEYSNRPWAEEAREVLRAHNSSLSS